MYWKCNTCEKTNIRSKPVLTYCAVNSHPWRRYLQTLCWDQNKSHMIQSSPVNQDWKKQQYGPHGAGNCTAYCVLLCTVYLSTSGTALSAGHLQRRGCFADWGQWGHQCGRHIAASCSSYSWCGSHPHLAVLLNRAPQRLDRSLDSLQAMWGWRKAEIEINLHMVNIKAKQLTAFPSELD